MIIKEFYKALSKTITLVCSLAALQFLWITITVLVSCFLSRKYDAILTTLLLIDIGFVAFGSFFQNKINQLLQHKKE